MLANVPTLSSPSPHRRANVNQDLSAAMPSTRISDLHVDSLPRPRANTASRDPYARNNDFMVRMASAERLDAEIGRLQRPTPPPAIGHGRPATRTRTRTMAHWQRDQENSEEATMSGLQEEFTNMHVRRDSDDSAVSTLR